MRELLLSSTLVMLASVLTAQQGKVFDNLSMESEILGMDRNYAVYLPADYETSHRSYPVLYLLHGATDDRTGWIQFGELLRIADEAIANGIATAMVIVMPDANAGKMGYFNDPRGEWSYEDFFFQEFIPLIEKEYRIRTDKRYRAISGLSMGGGGTMIYALHHPELFSSACPLSAYCGPITMEDIKSGRWYIDCGDEDFLYEGNSLVHIAMRKREIPHEFRIRDEVHSWTCWRVSLPKVLSFVSDHFHQN